MKFKPPSNIGGFFFYIIFIDMKILITENKLDKLIEKYGIVKTIKNIGGYDNFDKLAPDYFYSRDENNVMKFNKERAIDFINECVEVNNRRQDESSIYLYDYNSDIFYQEWDGEGDDDNEFYAYESRIESVSTDIAYGSIWQFDDEGHMFDDAYDNFQVPLNRLPEKILRDVFHMLYESFKV
jgi:hypothetical protein